MSCVSLRSILNTTPVVKCSQRLICRASSTPREDPLFSRRNLLRRSLHMSGLLVATEVLRKKIALAAEEDIVEEAEVEVPALEEKITVLPELEKKAVEAEVETIEEEISSVDEEIAKGDETADDVKKEASSIQAQIDSLRELLGF
eukprot:g727.t1